LKQIYLFISLQKWLTNFGDSTTRENTSTEQSLGLTTNSKYGATVWGLPKAEIAIGAETSEYSSYDLPNQENSKYQTVYW